MSTVDHQVRILERLAEHESKVGTLYALFKGKFRQDAAFWSDLEVEEKQHMEMLRHLRLAVKEGQGTFPMDRLELQNVENSLEFIRQHVALARTEKISRRTAVDWALTIERLILEKNLAEELCTVSDPLAASTFDNLRQETNQHRHRLERARRQLLNPFLFFLPLPGAKIPRGQ